MDEKDTKIGSKHEEPLLTRVREETIPKSSKRWILLGLLFYNTLCAGLLYLGFSVIEDKAREHFDVSRTAINSMAVLGTSMPLIMYPIAARVVDTKGIRLCHMIGTGVACMGAWIRFLGSSEYWLCFVGQAVLSVGMSFLNSLPASLSARWFPEEERSLATSIAMLSFLMGMAVGQGVASFFQDDISMYLLGQAGLLSVPIPFVYALVTNGPRTVDAVPKSFVDKDETKRTHDNDEEEQRRYLSVFAAMIRVLRTSSSIRWLCVAAMWGVGTFNTMLALIDEIVPPSIKGHESLLSGACFFAPGLLGTIVMAKYLDASRAYLTAGRLTCGVILVAFGVLCVGWNRDFPGLVYPSFAVIGSVGLGLIPLCVELGIELTFDPTTHLEGAVNAVVQSSINIGSMISLYAFDPGNLGIASKDAIFLWYAIISLALCCMLQIQPDYRRLAYERRHERRGQEEEKAIA